MEERVAEIGAFGPKEDVSSNDAADMEEAAEWAAQCQTGEFERAGLTQERHECQRLEKNPEFESLQVCHRSVECYQARSEHGDDSDWALCSRRPQSCDGRNHSW